MNNQSPPENHGGIRWPRVAAAVCIAITLYLVGRHVAHGLTEQFDLHAQAANQPMVHRAIMMATAFYIVLTAIPFMPGFEIGLGMLMMFGAEIAFLVYVSTVASLTLAYLLGRLLPVEAVAGMCGAMGLTRARQFVEGLAPLSAEERMEWLVRESPVRLMPGIVRHRYLLLAVLFNLPGNMVIGGGGGIALLAGMTRLFPLMAYLLTVALAVAPVPLIVHFTDWW